MEMVVWYVITNATKESATVRDGREGLGVFQNVWFGFGCSVPSSIELCVYVMSNPAYTTFSCCASKCLMPGLHVSETRS